MLKLLIGWKGYAAAAAITALLTAGATFYLTSLGYRLTIANMERDIATADAKVANASLSQFIEATNRIKGAADEYAGLLNTFNGKMGKISNDLRKAMQANPLPDGCRPDLVRVQSLSAAVAAANAAAGQRAGAAVSRNP